MRELLGPGRGACLEIGCGTGVRAAQVRSLGWTPVGADLSAGMLGHARDRLPVVLGDAGRLPVAGGCVPAIVAVMVHTDMPDYPAVLREAARVLRPAAGTTGRFFEGGHPLDFGKLLDRNVVLEIEDVGDDQDKAWPCRRCGT